MNPHAYPTFPAEATRWAEKHGGSYWPDMADEIDTPEEKLADELGISIKAAKSVLAFQEKALREHQALILGKVIGLLLETSNLPVMAHALAFAAGLDQLNGAKSQAKVAEELGVTRALMSHYVVGVRDVLSGKEGVFDNLKFRKRNSTRETFKAKATDPFTAAKAAAIAKLKNKQTTPCN